MRSGALMVPQPDPQPGPIEAPSVGVTTFDGDVRAAVLGVAKSDLLDSLRFRRDDRDTSPHRCRPRAPQGRPAPRSRTPDGATCLSVA